VSNHKQKLMFIFPGQGSQYRGMGQDLYEDHVLARQIYAQASAVLGYDMAELSFNDPHDQLNLTRFTQPALLTHAIACLEIFKELSHQRIIPQAAGGHSLGEYAALVVAGSLEFEAALRLVQQRGECMSTYGEGEMLAFPLDLATVRPLAEKHYCGVAGCNLPDQTVIGGLEADLDALVAETEGLFRRKRPVRLKTEGAFHTYFMVDAARHFRPALEAAEIAPPAIRVLSNYTGDYHEADPVTIKSRLFQQLFHPVLWLMNVQAALADGVTTFVEFGGGIGNGDTAAAKRPNLENMVKKAMRGNGHSARYLPAINSQSLQAAAEILCSEL